MDGQFERHFFYWILPSFVAIVLALMYYTGIPLLQTIIAPAVSRELGLLESTQHLLIVAVIWMAVRGWRGAQSQLERLGFTMMIGLASFQLLEELNYGQHYVRAYMRMQGLEETAVFQEPWNVHNRGISTPLKAIGDAIIAIYFFIFPLITTRRWPAWLQYLSPPRLIAITVFCSAIVSRFIHFVSDNTPVVENAFEVGVSEFRETFIYYFVLLYVRELATNRRWPGFRSRQSSDAQA